MPKNNNKNLPFSVSQNFLTSQRTIKRLLHLTSICEKDHVIEIGAGKGHITKELARVCRNVNAYEIDLKLYEQLQITLGNTFNIKINHQDFLESPLPCNGEYKVFSNIPFSITSQIMRKLTSSANPPAEAWLVMEKGAAKRFMGKPYDTLTSTLIKPFFDLEIKYYFSRSDFHPMPSAEAVLLHLKRKAHPDISAGEKACFVKFVEKGHKYGIEKSLTKRQVSTALKLAGLPSAKESGVVLYVQWLCLFRCYRRFHGGR